MPRDDGFGVELRAAIEDVRVDQRSNRNRAVMVLARHNAERIGYGWDELPWRSDDMARNDQAYFVMNAMPAVDRLIEAGFIAA